MADIITPLHDPENIYVLSSRFHKYFLKNLDSHDINVRIMRMRDFTKDPRSPSVSTRPPLTLITPGNTKAPITPAPIAHQTPALNYIPSGNSGVRSTSYTHFSTPYQTSSASFSVNHNSPVPKTPAPYAFEPIAVINKGIRNPFFQLNSGEKPAIFNNDIHKRLDITSAAVAHGHPSPLSSSYYFTSNHA